MVRSICDYILHGKNVKWKNFNMIDTMFDSDHRLIKGNLISRGGEEIKGIHERAIKASGESISRE